MSDYDLQSEIDRKANEAMINVLERLSTGALQGDAAQAALQAIWDATAGLTSRETMETLAEAIDSVREHHRDPRRRVFVKGDGMAVIDVPEKSSGYVSRLQIFEKGRHLSASVARAEEDHTPIEIARRFQNAINTLRSRGYEEETRC